MIIEVPVAAEAAQKFVTQLGEAKLVLDLQWNDRTQQFSLSLSNDETGQVYFYGVPLVLGTDFLEPYNYELGSLILLDVSKQEMEATLEDFGVRTKLYWLSADEVANAISSPV